MSEYQYYEFLAIDRPFSEEDRKVFSSLSSRATVTSRSASFVYNWGDFRGDPWTLVEERADFHYYLANWGVRLLMRLPPGAVTLELLASYEGDDGGISGRRAGDGFIVAFSTGEEHGFNDWLEGEGMAEELVPLREELMNGDHRFLYLGWLYGLQRALGIGTDGEPDVDADDGAEDAGKDPELDAEQEFDDDDENRAILGSSEPVVPAGLRSLTKAQEYFARLVGIDRFLLEAASEVSPTCKAVAAQDLAALVLGLPESEVRASLADLVRGDATVHFRVRQRLLAMWREEHQPAAEPPVARRTVRAMLLRARELRDAEEQRKRRKAEEERVRAAALRKKRIVALAPEAPRLWAKVEELIRRKLPAAYDEAMPVLADLLAIAQYKGDEVAFRERVDQLACAYRNRPALLSRLRQDGLLPDGWKAGC